MWSCALTAERKCLWSRWSFLSDFQSHESPWPKKRELSCLCCLQARIQLFPQETLVKTHCQIWRVLCELHAASEAAAGKTRRVWSLSLVYFLLQWLSCWGSSDTWKWHRYRAIEVWSPLGFQPPAHSLYKRRSTYSRFIIDLREVSMH